MKGGMEDGKGKMADSGNASGIDSGGMGTGGFV